MIKNESALTLREARKILGEELIDLSDTQVQLIINNLSLLAREVLTKTVPRNY